MSFGSYAFALLFLPAALALYYAVALTRLHGLRIPVLIALGLAFYGYGAARHLPLLLASIVLNYGVASLMVRRPAWTRALLWIGVSANVAALLLFKYTAFIADNLAALFGATPHAVPLALPLAISFYSFQQIAFLVETARGTVKLGPFHRYAAAVLLFPTLIAGPITFYRELDPQLAERPVARAVPGNVLVGLALFAIGLFKKTVLADSIALWVDPLFGAASAGHALTAAQAWGAAVAYWLQIYFDFSGYTDMAIGCARMLGLLVTVNFFSPIRSLTVIEYWRRWHVSLGRFVNLYIFMPLALPLARWAAMRDLSRGAAFAVGTLVPTFVTMLVIGTWHGGNWTYVVFGLMHASYMVIAEAWLWRTRKSRKGKTFGRPRRAAANLLTMTCVVLAMVPFRADRMGAAVSVWRSMAGLGHGPALAWPALGGAALLAVIVAGIAFAWTLPNAVQLLGRYEPVLEWPKWRAYPPAPIAFRWRPTLGWALATGAILALGLAFVARGSANFVYFGF